MYLNRFLFASRLTLIGSHCRKNFTFTRMTSSTNEYTHIGTTCLTMKYTHTGAPSSTIKIHPYIFNKFNPWKTHISHDKFEEWNLSSFIVLKSGCLKFSPWRSRSLGANSWHIFWLHLHTGVTWYYCSFVEQPLYMSTQHFYNILQSASVSIT